MNLIDIVLIAVIAAAFILAVVSCIRQKKKGSCCGNCSDCNGCKK